MIVFDACANAAFSACGSFSNVFAKAFSSTEPRDVVAIDVLDAGGHGGDDSGGAGEDVCCAGRRGTLWGGAAGVVSEVNNARTRFCIRSRFRMMNESRRSDDDVCCSWQVPPFTRATGLQQCGVRLRLSRLCLLAASTCIMHA